MNVDNRASIRALTLLASALLGCGESSSAAGGSDGASHASGGDVGSAQHEASVPSAGVLASMQTFCQHIVTAAKRCVETTGGDAGAIEAAPVDAGAPMPDAGRDDAQQEAKSSESSADSATLVDGAGSTAVPIIALDECMGDLLFFYDDVPGPCMNEFDRWVECSARYPVEGLICQEVGATVPGDVCKAANVGSCQEANRNR